MEKTSNRSKKDSLGDFLCHFEVWKLTDENYWDILGYLSHHSQFNWLQEHLSFSHSSLNRDQTPNIFHRSTSKLQRDTENLLVNLFSIGLKFFPSQISWETRSYHLFWPYVLTKETKPKSTLHVVQLCTQLRMSVRQFVMLSMWYQVWK